MLIEVDGFILSETPYSETSKIINVFTKEYGIIGVICKNAKSIKNKNRVATMKLTYSRFNIKYKKDKLSTLISADIIDPLKLIKSDIILISFLNYIADLTYQVLKQSNYYEYIYNDLIACILKMDKGLDPIVLMNILEIKYLKYLGILFDLEACVLCHNKNHLVTIDAYKGGFVCSDCLTNEIVVNIKVVKLIKMYYYVDIKNLKDISIEENFKKTINIFLDMYYDRYTGLYLNCKNFLKKLL
mgnify:CR=1 FL=1